MTHVGEERRFCPIGLIGPLPRLPFSSDRSAGRQVAQDDVGAPSVRGLSRFLFRNVLLDGQVMGDLSHPAGESAR
ncbi:MAG: hypothetical protein IPJ38_01040 [Dechloromonas sp.]|uniref:Uncharacterized protein n=1 Tax=Candidatus Dechloromonas phosphorivorans TaxID=2899244 RepID=A0A935K7U5_9RHOO|nr:hypothetical protein [Candidatus Dechloromonas phosphorivorans]